MRLLNATIVLITAGIFLYPGMTEAEPVTAYPALIHRAAPGFDSQIAYSTKMLTVPVRNTSSEYPSMETVTVPERPTVQLTTQPGSDHHVRGVAHLVGSHLSAVIRPVSTVFRLVSLVAYTGLDALRSTPRRDIPQEPPPPVKQGPGMDLAAWEEELDAITRSRSSMGSMELLIDGEEFFPRLERTVANAGRSVHIQTYIFDNDDYALDFGRLLKDRSRNVEVKILMDGLGSIMASGVDHKSTPDNHTPPPSLVSYLKEGSSIKVRKLPNPWVTFDHTKSIVIDSRTAFVGGMNIGREYRYVWHDMMVQVKGPVIDTLQEEFSKTWDYAGIVGDLALVTSYKKPDVTRTETSHYPVRVLKTRIGHSQIYRAQVAAIRRARSYIYIENPYLSDDVILHELIMARHRGVDVRVILPLDCNWKAMRRSNVLAANEMLANSIRVYMYPGMSHVKAAVIDGWACLGSANFDKASLRLNREINLATSHPALVDKLITRLFEKDFKKSSPLTEFNQEKKSDRLYEMVADLM
jgi:cardiolipin synthase